MKRSEINRIMAEADEFIRRHGFILPPFACWPSEAFKANAVQARHVIEGVKFRDEEPIEATKDHAAA